MVIDRKLNLGDYVVRGFYSTKMTRIDIRDVPVEMRLPRVPVGVHFPLPYSGDFDTGFTMMAYAAISPSQTGYCTAKRTIRSQGEDDE